MSDAVTPHGCRILYHNHDDEFYSVRDSGTAMDVFLAHAGPDVLLQVDIGWAGMAGDEQEIVKRYADRIASLHLKDFYPQYRTGYTRTNMPVEAFAPIGEGAVRTQEILGMTRSFPRFAGTIVIDQDESRGEMLDSLKIGLGNIRKMLQEEEG